MEEAQNKEVMALHMAANDVKGKSTPLKVTFQSSQMVDDTSMIRFVRKVNGHNEHKQRKINRYLVKRKEQNDLNNNRMNQKQNNNTTKEEEQFCYHVLGLYIRREQYI